MGPITKILIVDDSSFFRSFLHEILEVRKLASEVIEAADGLDAVKKYKEFKPDLVMMDMRMPRADGIQALRAILKTNSDAKLIMVSSVKDEDLIGLALRIGALDYVKKPFDNSEVAKMVERVLNPKKIEVLSKVN